MWTKHGMAIIRRNYSHDNLRHIHDFKTVPKITWNYQKCMIPYKYSAEQDGNFRNEICASFYFIYEYEYFTHFQFTCVLCSVFAVAHRAYVRQFEVILKYPEFV